MVTLSEWVSSWIDRRTLRLAPSTISGYRGNLRRYIIPSPAGSLPIDHIAPEDLIVLLSPIVARGHTRQAQLVQILLGAALKDAVRRQIIAVNPMILLDRIQHKSNVTAWLTPEQAKKLLSTSRERGDPFYPAWLLGLCCGLRRGEILGLKWTDIETDELHVRRQHIRIDGKTLETPPKSLTSIRDIPLPHGLARQLFSYRGISPYVVNATADQLAGALDHALKMADLPKISLHGLRHTMAATAASEGIPIKVLQQLMGHAHYSTTADLYAHIDRFAIEKASRTIATRLEIA